MAQKLYEDKITTLTQSAGTLTLPAGARLTIGGQQYTINSALNVAANVSSANTRYQIYAVLNSGNVELVVSSNENSVGPAGYTAWKLVGSYYTNGLTTVGFGSFVNINSAPETEDIRVDQTLGGLSGFQQGPYHIWKRRGDMIIGKISFIKNGFAGSGGTLIVTPPQNIVWDGAQASGIVSFSKVGDAALYNMGIGLNYDRTTAVLLELGSNNLNILNPGTGTVLTESDVLASSQLYLDYELYVSGWSNTAIKDL